MLLFLIFFGWFIEGVFWFAAISLWAIVGGLRLVAKALFYGSAYAYGYWMARRDRKLAGGPAPAPAPARAGAQAVVVVEDGYIDTRASRSVEGIDEYIRRPWAKAA